MGFFDREPKKEAVPQSETAALLHAAIPSSSGPTPETDLAKQKAINALLPVEYRAALSDEGIELGGGGSTEKIEIKISRTADWIAKKPDEIRLFIKYRKGGMPRLEVTKGWGEWPVKEYPLPENIADAQAKIWDVMNAELRHPDSGQL